MSYCICLCYHYNYKACSSTESRISTCISIGAISTNEKDANDKKD